MNWAPKGGSSDLSGPTGRTAHSFDRKALLAVPWAIGRETNGRVGLSGGSCLYPAWSVLSQGRLTKVSRSAIPPIRDSSTPQVMSDRFDDDPGNSSGGSSNRSGKHCNEWLDSSDTRCPDYGMER